MRLNSVIVRLRQLRTRGLSFNNTADIVKYGAELYFNERLRNTRPTTNRMQRKRSRLKPPPNRKGFALYRSDGAARGQGSTSNTRIGCGWGAVYYGESGHDSVPEQVAWGWLGELKTNNEAEYEGLIYALEHAQQYGHRRLTCQLDSLLVVKQVCGCWACKSLIIGTVLHGCHAAHSKHGIERGPHHHRTHLQGIQQPRGSLRKRRRRYEVDKRLA